MADNNFNHYMRIRILDSITLSMIAFAEKNGVSNFCDYIDLNCGAVPHGNYEEVIDPDTQELFLNMYTAMAEKRFAYAVSGLLQIDRTILSSIKDLCFRTGKENTIPDIKTIQDAYSAIDLLILDGFSNRSDEKIVLQSEDSITWKTDVKIHQKAWENTEEELTIYYTLIESLAKGIIFDTPYTLLYNDDFTFTLKK